MEERMTEERVGEVRGSTRAEFARARAWLMMGLPVYAAITAAMVAWVIVVLPSAIVVFLASLAGADGGVGLLIAFSVVSFAVAIISPLAMFGALALWLGMLSLLRSISQGEHTSGALRLQPMFNWVVGLILISGTSLIAGAIMLLVSNSEGGAEFEAEAIAAGAGYIVVATFCVVASVYMLIRLPGVLKRNPESLNRVSSTPLYLVVLVILGTGGVLFLSVYALGPFVSFLTAGLLALVMAITLIANVSHIWRNGHRGLSATAAAAFAAVAVALVAVFAATLIEATRAGLGEGNVPAIAYFFFLPFVMPLGFLLLPLLLRLSASYTRLLRAGSATTEG